MSVFKNIYSQFNLKYLIKTYIIGIAFAYLAWNYIYEGGSTSIKIFIILSAILFPFATIIYDSVIDLFFGGLELRINILIFIGYKLFKIIMLFMFTIFIAPIGLIFLIVRSKISQA
ncbi:hypothetical protein [Pseudogracilibacillus sp. SO30301A]|uniref:hypothetical protein n=1 Tax=Pseudogracilibacillus sp. SO30301A TaxID=3098291 RepID=UPI00300DCD30